MGALRLCRGEQRVRDPVRGGQDRGAQGARCMPGEPRQVVQRRGHVCGIPRGDRGVRHHLRHGQHPQQDGHAPDEALRVDGCRRRFRHLVRDWRWSRGRILRGPEFRHERQGQGCLLRGVQRARRLLPHRRGHPVPPLPRYRDQVQEEARDRPREQGRHRARAGGALRRLPDHPRDDLGRQGPPLHRHVHLPPVLHRGAPRGARDLYLPGRRERERPTPGYCHRWLHRDLHRVCRRAGHPLRRQGDEGHVVVPRQHHRLHPLHLGRPRFHVGLCIQVCSRA
mmetsp:Transcript_11826/g.27358  ORF Transcript_11826/g.27358 Transcript_11826/m.27358 type:complete len:281 (-) Transcript_11826:625-1467(-)